MPTIESSRTRLELHNYLQAEGYPVKSVRKTGATLGDLLVFFDGTSQAVKDAAVTAGVAWYTTNSDIAERIEARRDSAREQLRAIPNWATIDKATLKTWIDANIATGIPLDDLIANINTFCTRAGYMLIAIRDGEYPDIGEDL